MQNINKYQNGKIYKITSQCTDKIYIGSTTSPLSIRLSKHKAALELFNSGYSNSKVSSFEILKYPDATIELIEEYQCNDNLELSKREAYHIFDNIDNIVNKRIPGRNFKDKQVRSDYAKFRYHNKIEKNIECECGKIVKSQKYFEAHKRTTLHKKLAQNKIDNINNNNAI